MSDPNQTELPRTKDKRLAGGATLPQLTYIVALLTERDVTEESIRKAQTVIDDGELTKELASRWIKRLLSLPRRGTAITRPSDDENSAANTPMYGPWHVRYSVISQNPRGEDNYAGYLFGGAAPIPRGAYAILTPDDPVNPVKFYKVWISDKDHPRYGSGRFNVKVCHGDEETVLKKDSQIAVLNEIALQGPLASAARYGHEIGKCGICGRRLTNKESRDAGIGPVCAGRYHV